MPNFIATVDVRCYNCGKKIRKGEKYASGMARPRSRQALKNHYFFAAVHQPKCETKLKNRQMSFIKSLNSWE